MESKLVLDVCQETISIALLEDNRLVELNKESREASYSVGNIYLGRVKKVMPGLNAAFVDVGYGKDAFLHYLDLGFHYNTVAEFTKVALSNRKKKSDMKKVQVKEEVPKEGLISDYLTTGKEILVQVVKEPISTKGPRLSAEISIAGRTLVLMPFSNKVSISQKIQSKEERSRLKKALQSVKPRNYGVIVRTVAEGKPKEELEAELIGLVKRWEEALFRLQKTKKTPSLIVEEIGRTEAILRDHFSPNFSSIYINDKAVCEDIKSYVGSINGKEKLVKYYDDKLPIFDSFNVTKQLKSSFGKIVPFKKSAYLVIEHTEALHVIDVNSGNRTKADRLQEDNALDVNLAAVDEVARQLRLRDMGGIIVIDLIDLHTGEYKQQVFDRMKDNMKSDSAKHNILPLSKFGLMQITRQRVRPVMLIDTQEKCPNCEKGSIRPSLLFVDMLGSKIDSLYLKLKVKYFTLFVHPYVYAFIKAGFPSIAFKWKLRYGIGVKVLPDQSLAYLQYRFVDRNAQEIDLKDPMEMA